MALAKKGWLLLIVLLWCSVGQGQRVINYESGMGARDPHNADVWILYQHVVSTHEGMVLTADSAHYNTATNCFTAFVGVKIKLTDSTHIYGDRLYYDGNTRVLDIWADTVVLIDGGTTLKANHMTYDRDHATAYYTRWGHATSEDRVLDSHKGQYNSNLKMFYIYDEVRLADSSMVLVTDTLIYSTESKIAHFDSPTHIYSDSSTIYSELGNYNTVTRFAESFRRSHVDNQGRMIDSDTLYYDELTESGRAYGHVMIMDSLNEVACTGRYGEMSRRQHYSYVTDSAHVLFVSGGDTLFMHGDTVYVVTDTASRLSSISAYFRVKVFRRDAQGMCDSAFYNARDSILTLYRAPVLWYDHYQCTADTIELHHDTSGIKRVYLRSKCFTLQQVDLVKFNQLKGLQGIVYFKQGQPLYADILGNAQIVYYLTEDDEFSNPQLIGVNAGVGTDMRIYFDTSGAVSRVVTYDNPDMQTYPVDALPEDLQRLIGFQWYSVGRPKKPEDVFVW